MWTARSLVISTRFLKSSGRTSLAIAAKSSGFLMSCFGNGIPPFGHSIIALADGLLVRGRPRDVDLEELGHAGRVLAGLAGALLELGPQHPDLLVGGTDRDHPVGEAARSAWR